MEGSAEVRLAAGDLLLVLHDGEAVGAGRISEVATGRPLGRLDWVERELPGRGWALVVARDLPIRVEPNLPPFIRRNARPGPVVSLNGRGGEQPDRKTAPQRLGVVAIEANGDHQILDLAPVGPVWGVPDRQMPTTARAGTAEMATMGIGDRCDLYRGTRYAGFAKVNSIGQGSVRAETLASLCRGPVQVGDLAVRRLPPGTEVAQYGYVFRREADYVLVSLGEADGVRRGDRLFARSADGAEYRLLVSHVYPEHCGATVETDDNDPPCEPAAWDAVCNSSPPSLVVPVPPAAWGRTGSSWLVAVRSALVPRNIRQGDIVFVSNQVDGVGVVVVAGTTDVYLFVPGCWTVPRLEMGTDGH
ncbi:MAG: hypothetical protein ACYSUQ_01630 [Planctomycetota bacterium]